jgi:hypothetical protein
MGLFYDGAAEHGASSAVFGATVAHDEFTRALLKQGKLERYEIFASPGRVDAVTEELMNYAPHSPTKSPRVAVNSYQRLIDQFDGYGFTIWHDSGANFHRPFHLRAIRSKALYPITFTHHTISYQPMIRTWILPLLLHSG